MASQDRLRIAIIGAGIAGLAAAIALQDHDGIEVQICERASELKEIGASIALGPNGMKALERLGVYEALDDDLAFRNQSACPMIYRHWKTNEIVSMDQHHGEVEYRHRSSRFFRPHLQQALLAHIKPGTLHLRKTFQSVETSAENDDLVVTFQDGNTVTADILLGADGIQSAVRRFFVPASAPKWTGWVAFRSVFDASLVEHIPGVLDEAYHWWGPDRTFFSSKLGKDLFSFWEDATWNSDGDVNVLKEYYKDWHPTIRQMIDASPDTRMYPNTFAGSLDTWVYEDGRVTFAGDAAHAHGGAFAAGGSLAFDDSWAFARAILTAFPVGSAKPSNKTILQALKVYEATRKPHTDRVLATVHANNKDIIDRVGSVETDEQLRTRMKNRADPYWIHEHDVDAAFEEVLSQDVEQLQARL